MTRPLSRGGALLLASIAGTAIANSYAVQPALTAVAAGRPPLRDRPRTDRRARRLRDRLRASAAPHRPRRPNRLVAAQLTALAAALTLAACAAASVAAQASNIAGRHARPGRRGTGVATVSAGMAAGILLSRLAGGALTDGLGWRRMLLVFATLALLGVIAAAALLPRERPSADRGYRAALMSLHPLPRQWGTGEVRPTRRRRGRRM